MIDVLERLFYTEDMVGALTYSVPKFRLVLPRDKRDRLERRAEALTTLRRCSVADCEAESLSVVVVETEQEAVLCPRHQLVWPDGTHVEGQPMLATAAW